MEELKFEKFAIEEEGIFVSDYKIWNEKRKLIAEAKGHFFSRAKDVFFYDDEKSKYQIQQLGFLSKEYHIVKDKVTEVILTKQLSFVKSEYVIESRNYSNIILRGNMWKNDYTMEHAGVEIAKVSRQSTIFSKDTYGTAIRGDFDYKLALCIIIILDIMIDIERQKK